MSNTKIFAVAGRDCPALPEGIAPPRLHWIASRKALPGIFRAPLSTGFSIPWTCILSKARRFGRFCGL